ncbi:MAG: beta-lactamase family protein [Candidatus Marinimicrobia bacterium]|nr:beta-lactamase family protein [Candidatus Neomarinimicrobiota bacterium]
MSLPRSKLRGILSIKDFARLIPVHPDSAITPIEAINTAYKNKDLNFIPGEKFEYSNTNFNILGIILEKVTGTSFDQLIKKYFSEIAPTLRMDDGKGNYPKGYMKPWPFHWGTTGYSGSLISTAEDAMKVFSYITNQPEFKLMSDWHRRTHNENMLCGFGILGYENYHGLGKAIYYDGNMIACQMFILKIDNMVYYFHTAHMENTERLYNLVRDIVSMVHKS